MWFRPLQIIVLFLIPLQFPPTSIFCIANRIKSILQSHQLTFDLLLQAVCTWSCSVLFSGRFTAFTIFKLELSRAHTPRTPSICNLLHRDRPVMLMISTRPVVRMSSAVKWARSMGKKKMLFVTPMDRAKQFEAHSSQSFTDFDQLVTLTSCPES